MANAEKKYFEYLEAKGQLPKAEDDALGEETQESFGNDFSPSEHEEEKLYALDEEGDSHVEHFSEGGVAGESPIRHLLNALKNKRG